nr:unnamed protein product [Callosobruchus analis]
MPEEAQKNLTKTINTFAIPVLTYSFGIIKWSHTDIENIHILIRTQFTQHRMSHPNTCKERLTIDRKQSRRRYTHHMQSQQDKINTWAQKVLHGKHRYHITQDHINEQLSYTWLQDGQLFPETEGFMLAIQDQVIATRNYSYKKCIIKDPSVADDNCRKCHQQKETIDHITSGCRALAGTEYIARHNSAANVIHQALATTNQLIENNDPYYNYAPTSVLENNQYKLYWDVEIHTDKTIRANRPDIVFQSKADRVTYLIDIAIPNDKNIQNTYTGRISKYTDLAIEIKRLWKQNKEVAQHLPQAIRCVATPRGNPKPRDANQSATSTKCILRGQFVPLPPKMSAGGPKANLMGPTLGFDHHRGKAPTPGRYRKPAMGMVVENLLIDRCVTQDSVQYKRNLSTAWIDYRKAFDITSHELIVRLLECLSVDNQIVGCIKQLMPLWMTRFSIASGETRVRTELVTFKRGVFQGDSLSPLLFCISLLPLSITLKNTKGYSCGTPNHRRHRVTHLFYMDDLKLYASGQRDLQHALRVVQEYSHAIGMEFGTDKCAMVHLKKGRCGDSEEEEQLGDGSILRHHAETPIPTLE